jgi:CysZ protein
MNILNGIMYNFRGLWFSIKHPVLLFWGLLRFVLVAVITLAAASLILFYHREILNALWAQPEGRWTFLLWQGVSWLLSLFLVGISAILSYLFSQVLFSVVIMDHMARITEAKATGGIQEPNNLPFLSHFFYLMRQEIPRKLLPVMFTLFLIVIGWLALLGPFVTILSSALAIIFLAWDSTDLIPARNRVPFRVRFKSLLKNLPFHLGFGLPFLIPGLNLLLLAFAPVGGTLYFLKANPKPKSPRENQGNSRASFR